MNSESKWWFFREQELSDRCGQQASSESLGNLKKKEVSIVDIEVGKNCRIRERKRG